MSIFSGNTNKTVLQNISIDIIDDPAEPMRTEMDEEKLDELAQSIKNNGLIQPITLRKVGERYEVVAGHRRFKACGRAGLILIPSIIKELTEEETDSIRMHENLYREDINPVDEAKYIALMIEKHQVEPEALAKMTGKSEAYLMQRYNLLSYPAYLLDAVKNETVSLAAAFWLNKIEDEAIRSEYTRFAVIGGITAKRANAWHDSWKAGSLPRDPNTYVPVVSTDPIVPLRLTQKCVLCRLEDDVHNMNMFYAHLECAKAVEKIG